MSGDVRRGAVVMCVFVHRTQWSSRGSVSRQGGDDGDTSSEGVVDTDAARHGTDEADHSNTAGESGSRLVGNGVVIALTSS